MTLVKQIAAFLLLVSGSLLPAQTVTLEGTIANADGTPFNGSALLQIPRSTVTDICTTPVQILPSVSIAIAIKNGVFTPTNAYTTDCIAPRLPYHVSLKNSTGAEILSDNWYIPQTSDGIVNVGNLSTVRMASAINVAVPQAIIADPHGTQTITQPNGSYTVVNNLEVTNSLVYNGSSLSLSGLTASSATINNLTASTASIGTLTATGNSSLQGTLSVAGASTLGAVSANSMTISSLPAGYMVCTSGGGALAVSGCPGIGSIYYQSIRNPSTSLPQEHNLSFSSEFAVTDNSAGVSTNVDLVPTGVTSGSYSLPTLTVNAYGQITSINSTSIFVPFSLNGSAAGCSTAGDNSYGTCVTYVSWPGNGFPDLNYTPLCTGENPSNPRLVVSGITSKTTSQVGVYIVSTGSGGPYHYETIRCVGREDN